MAKIIHPRAVISPKAEIADGVKIGPYSIIGDNVKIDEGTEIGSGVLIEGWTKIGKGCKILHGAVIGTPPQDSKYKGEKSFVEIGDNNLIREYVTIHRGTEKESITYIGNNNLMAYCHIAHNCWIGNEVIIANGGTLAGYVKVENKAVIGGLTGIHQFVRIGTLAMVGGCTKVVKDIPPFTLANGNPALLWGLNVVGLKRAGIPLKTREKLKKAYKILFKSGLNTTQALEKIENEFENIPEVRYLCDFIRSSNRGICKERTRQK